jgi:hypothetical protein
VKGSSDFNFSPDLVRVYNTRPDLGYTIKCLNYLCHKADDHFLNSGTVAEFRVVTATIWSILGRELEDFQSE